MSAGRSKATENVLGASKIDSCEVSPFVSYIQQPEARSTDSDALWDAVESKLFACVRLLGLLYGSRKQADAGSKQLDKKVYWLRGREQSLFADQPRDKKGGASKKRDIR